MDGVGIDMGSTVFYTTNGGETAADWTAVPLKSVGFRGESFSLLPNLHVRAAGSRYCDSWTAGRSGAAFLPLTVLTMTLHFSWTTITAGWEAANLSSKWDGCEPPRTAATLVGPHAEQRMAGTGNPICRSTERMGRRRQLVEGDRWHLLQQRWRPHLVARSPGCLRDDLRTQVPAQAGKVRVLCVGFKQGGSVLFAQTVPR